MESFVNWITTVNNAVNGVVWGPIGLALLFFGAGVLIGSLLPPCWTVRLLAAAVIAAGLLLCQSL